MGSREHHLEPALRVLRRLQGHPEQSPSCANPCWLLGDTRPRPISASPQPSDGHQQSSGAACGPRGTADPTHELWDLCAPKHTWQRVPAAVAGLGVGGSGVSRACLHPTAPSAAVYPGAPGFVSSELQDTALTTQRGCPEVLHRV